MKGIKKYLFIMAALAAVFGFVACGDDEEDNTVAVYTAVEEDATYTVTFSDDNTFSVSGSGDGMTLTMAEGTYEGDPSKDSTIKVTVKKIVDFNDESGKLVDASPSEFPASTPVEIKGGKFEFLYWEFTRK